MINWKRFASIEVFKTLRMKSNAVIQTENADGSSQDVSLAELNKLDAVTAGTVAASKAVVVDANKDISVFRNVGVTNLDAGASGTAGTVDVFPTTAAKGKVSITAADSAGDTTTTIVNASQAAARTYTIPDAGASASFVMTEGAATINGNKTFSGVTRSPRVVTSEGAPTSSNNAGGNTVTAAQILTGIYVRDPNGAGRTDTLDTAANIVAAVSGAAVGDVIRLLIVNGADAAETITIAAGAGGGFDANQTASSRVIPQNTSKRVHIRLTNVTPAAEAYVIYA